MQIFNSVLKKEVCSLVLRAVKTTSGVIPVQPDLFNGKDIPEYIRNQPIEDFSDEQSTSSSKAAFIVDNLLVNYFAVAREVAIQTYTNDWFKNEQDAMFKIALALELSITFGIDGYRNIVWNTFAGLPE